MSNLVIYHENNIEIKKKIKYYKKLGTNAVLIDPFKKVDEESNKEMSKLTGGFNIPGF